MEIILAKYSYMLIERIPTKDFTKQKTSMKSFSMCFIFNRVSPSTPALQFFFNHDPEENKPSATTAWQQTPDVHRAEPNYTSSHHM